MNMETTKGNDTNPAILISGTELSDNVRQFVQWLVTDCLAETTAATYTEDDAWHDPTTSPNP